MSCMAENDEIPSKSSDPATVEVQTEATAPSGTYRVVVQAMATPQFVEIPNVNARAGQRLEIRFDDKASLGPVSLAIDLLQICQAINDSEENVDKSNKNAKRVFATCSADELMIKAVLPGAPGSFTALLVSSDGTTERILSSGGANAVVTVNDVHASVCGNQVKEAVPGALLTVMRPGSAVITIGSGAPVINPMARRTFIVTTGWFGVLAALAIFYGNFWHWSWLESAPDNHGVRHLVFGANLGPVPIGALWFGAVGAVLASWAGIFQHNTDWQNSYDYWHWVRPAVGAILGAVSVLMLIVLLNATTGTTDLGTSAEKNSRALFFVLAFIVGYREATFRSLIGKVTDLILGPGSTPNPAVTAGSPPPSPAPASSSSATPNPTDTTAQPTGGASAKQ